MARPLPQHALPRLEAIVARWWLQTRDRSTQKMGLLVALGLHGLRAIEVCRARRQWVDRAACTIRVISAKRGLPRLIELDPRLVDKLLAHPNARQRAPNDPLVPTRTGAAYTTALIDHMFYRRVCPLLGAHYSFHSLRHAAARRLWAATHDILAVQRLLGHRTLSQTHAYLQELVPPGPAAMPQWHLPRTTTYLRLFNPYATRWP
jgi:integrase